MTLTTASNLLSENEALSLVESVIKQSQAEGVFVSLTSNEEALSRYSENQISQNISKTQFNLSVTSYYGKRSATAATTELDAEAIAQTIRNSETLARIAPEDPEWVPLLPPQIYDKRTPAFDENTATISPLKKGEIIREVCNLSKKYGVNGSGTLSTEATLLAIGNSQGLLVGNKTTQADFSFTAKIDDGSSWSNCTGWAVEQLPITSLTEKVIDRAGKTRQPREIKPGIYPVILDSAAFVDLLSWVIWNLDARSADEGRSFMSRIDATGQPIGNRLGEAMFSPLVQVQRYPDHPLLRSNTFFADGLPNNYLEIIKNGVPQTLAYSRYWAQQQNQKPTGSMFPIVMTGTDQNLDDLISQTEQGILVSRAWYVRYINPRTLEVTGMTRDGTFWIENGAIAYPIKNMRFNQSLPDMLANIDALGKCDRFGNSLVPAVRVSAFNFSSITDSI